ncbi:Protein of unknown function [Cotesia congregata]|uniref:Uncharacterized protein n=1 Tax=Cotesia congregata TaxID=51543 RepID=A0A8J2HB24_COTCN|nr:Protein of unknown function [Cotesia congregata]
MLFSGNFFSFVGYCPDSATNNNDNDKYYYCCYLNPAQLTIVPSTGNNHEIINSPDTKQLIYPKKVGLKQCSVCCVFRLAKL